MFNIFHDQRQLSPAPLLAAAAPLAKGAAAKGAAAKGAGAAGKGAGAKGAGAAGKGGGMDFSNMMQGGGQGGGKGGKKGLPFLQKAPELIAGTGAWLQGRKQRRLGRKQLKKAEGISDVRPRYDIPKEYREGLATARNLYQGEDPVAKQARENIQKGTSDLVARAGKYATSGADVLGMLGAGQQQENVAMQQQAAQNAAQRRASMSAYQTALTQMGQQQEEAFKYNVDDPYKERVKTKAALTEAGLKNKQLGSKAQWGAASKLAGTIVEGMGQGKSQTDDAAGPTPADASGKKKPQRKPGIGSPTANPNAQTKPGIGNPKYNPKNAKKPGVGINSEAFAKTFKL